MVSKWPQNDPKIAQNDLNVFKVTFGTISIRALFLLRLFWVVTWLVCNNFEFGATNWPGMVPKWPKNDPKIAPNDLNRFKVTSETISIRILLLLRLFWVVTWLVCNNFELGATNWPGMVPKWPQNGPKMTPNDLKSSRWLLKPSPSKFCPSCGHFEWSHD